MPMEMMVRVKSYIIRKPLVIASYALVTSLSIYSMNELRVPSSWNLVVRSVGIACFILSALAMAKIHSMYPEKHDSPSDFPELLTHGPYSICRHPFYGCLIVNFFSIAIAFLSPLGLLVSIALVPPWIAFMKLEEIELIEYWGR